MFGFLNVYKPKGMTSHDVVAFLRRVTKIKQIGHTGTLDPFAEGVLPICIGKATRLIEYLEDDKEYVGTVQLGTSTTTYDIEGDVVNSSDKKITKEEIENALNDFRGEISQLPPVYSAIKVGGKKLYEYAREGKEVEIQPRVVTITKLELEEFNSSENQIVLRIACSKGTYIRSIANDLGEKLGTYAHLIKLERVKAGCFLKQDAIPLNNFDSSEKVLENLIPPIEKLNYPVYELKEYELNKVSHGMSFKSEQKDGILLLLSNGNLVAVGDSKDNIIYTKKVFI